MGTADSKAILATDLQRMRNASIPDDDTTVFDHLLQLPGSVLDLFGVIQPDDVRYIKGFQPRNLGRLLNFAILEIQQLVSAAPKTRLTPATQLRLLNAIRVLTRVLPILLEDPDDDLTNDLFWGNELPKHRPPTAAQVAVVQAAIASGKPAPASGEGDVPAAPAGPAVDPSTVPQETLFISSGAPLGVQLVESIMYLLFTPGFTIDAAQFASWQTQLSDHKEAVEEAKAARAAKEQVRSPASQQSGPSEVKSPGTEPTTDEGDTTDSSIVDGESEEGDYDDGDESDGEEALDGDPLTTSVWSTLLWTAGVSFPEIKPKKTAQFSSNRVEVLRLLLVILSETMYVEPNPARPHRSPWCDVAVRASTPLAPTLFYCLLNTGLSYDPIGWGIPYGSTFVSDNDEPLADICLQVLGVLLDYAPYVIKRRAPEGAEGAGGAGSPGTDTSALTETTDTDAEDGERMTLFNIYRSMLHSLNEAPDMEFIIAGITRLLSNLHESANTYLPGCNKQISSYQEILVLLWKLLDENQAFTQALVNHEKLLPLTVSLVYMMWSGRLNPTKVGLAHICTFILLLVSGNRQFCVALNAPFNTKLPADLPLFRGSHIDLLIIVLHKMTVNGSAKLAPLYNCFLTIISNLSPYAKTLSMVASTKIISLLELFSTKKFLLARPENHTFVDHLLDTVNNLVQYQYEGNGHLVYSIIRRRKVFENLITLDVEDAYTAGAADVASEVSGADDKEAEAGDSKPAEAAPAIAPAENLATQQARTAHEQSKSAGGFVPSREWLAAWKSKLQLGTVIRLIEYLSPLVEKFVSKSSSVPDEEVVLDFIRKTTMVGVLPVPHPIITRRYQPNQYTALWFSTFLWGVVFLRNQDIPVFDAEAIKLFTVTIVN